MCSIRMDGGKRMVDLADSRTLPQFFYYFHGSCRERITIRDSSMPKILLSKCDVSFVCGPGKHVTQYYNV